MRGYLLIVLIFGWLPVLIFKPHVGVLVWDWISHMVPHSTSYLTKNMQILDAIAGLTIIGLFISKEPRKIPSHPILTVMLLFFLWALIITILGYDPAASSSKFIKFFKVILFVVLSAIVMQSPIRLKAYYWVMALALGFFAIKGGLFTIATGGGARVQGPGGMFTDNNQFALALSMMIPVAYYLYLHPPMKILKWPMLASVFLTFLAVVGTNSRGGLVAGLAVMGMLYLNMKKGKLLVMALLVPGMILGWQVLPEASKMRYKTIFSAVGAGEKNEEVAVKKKEEGNDESFKGRVVMWRYAMNVVKERPLTGGGFEVHYLPQTRDKFMPVGDYRVMAWHSIYFEVLGEMGFVGLFLFLTLIFTAWYSGMTTYKELKEHEDLLWLADMARTLRLSLVGYCVAGLTVNVSTLDLLYDMCMVLALCSVVGRKILSVRNTKAETFNPFGVENAHDFHKEQHKDLSVEEEDPDDPYGLKKIKGRKKQKWSPH